ncbi:hypothetical protein FLW53_39295 [Microbispora sp. SCL1-1]|uniref:hypothetical protein n=1 Tax=Microbispora TaxID=2005 RepID=UPI001157C3F2|nr:MULTISPECIES: hypothetical protein [unclassified Microbispora]NJP30133.1 hypothetical protein [Microbispora sp. CL1-1]TQS02784.1 hypothetical protein FLW53_39295 [Microbispora sp. SCL1-1]
MLTVLCSGGHAAGTTTTALALFLEWPRPALLVEADPGGGTILSGYLAGTPRDRGLAEWGVKIRRGVAAAEALWDQLYAIQDGRLILPGLAEPKQAMALQPLWPEIVGCLAALDEDVVVDLGQVGRPDTPNDLLARADRVFVVTRPTLAHLHATTSAIRDVQELRGHLPDAELIVVGDGQYQLKEIGKTLGATVAAWLPSDKWSAPALAYGVGRIRPMSPLMRSARALAAALVAQSDQVMA